MLLWIMRFSLLGSLDAIPGAVLFSLVPTVLRGNRYGR